MSEAVWKKKKFTIHQTIEFVSSDESLCLAANDLIHARPANIGSRQPKNHGSVQSRFARVPVRSKVGGHICEDGSDPSTRLIRPMQPTTNKAGHHVAKNVSIA
mmetsp:Transcript_4189/g.10072  ORF Transcript_4189/g.10072 Transcript_4189/m.10072 type:complete len:103 (-) Transcript_4189:115-423(-)